MPDEHDEQARSRSFAQLIAVRDRLRDPGGCPWDREQTVHTAKTYLLEEAFEAAEAADAEDWPALAEELGDLIFQALFLVRIAADQGRFGDAEVLDGIRHKLVRRHPHVFGDEQAADSEAVLRTWGRAKQAEGKHRQSFLDGVPRAMPALAAAHRLQEKARQVGFDWPTAEGPRAKVIEEQDELQAALDTDDRGRIEAELGDLLFAATNLARHLGFEAEGALRGANARFRNRFAAIELGLAEQGVAIEDADLETMDALWEAAKADE